jgi:hypothetical protein
MSAPARLFLLSCTVLGLSGCAPMLAMVGANQGMVQIIAQVERAKLLGDGASYLNSSKTITDHALSRLTGDDCKVFNMLDRKALCMTTAAANDRKPAAKATNSAAITAQPQPQMTVDSDLPNAWFPHATSAVEWQAPAEIKRSDLIQLSRNNAEG